MKKLGIIICDRWRRCAGGKCLRALEERQDAFGRYEGEEVELAGYTTCDGRPGGNIEYTPAEMKKNGVEVVHLAIGLLVGYPPCPFIRTMRMYSRNGSFSLRVKTRLSATASRRANSSPFALVLTEKTWVRFLSSRSKVSIRSRSAWPYVGEKSSRLRADPKTMTPGPNPNAVKMAGTRDGNRQQSSNIAWRVFVRTPESDLGRWPGVHLKMRKHPCIRGPKSTTSPLS